MTLVTLISARHRRPLGSTVGVIRKCGKSECSHRRQKVSSAPGLVAKKLLEWYHGPGAKLLQHCARARSGKVAWWSERAAFDQCSTASTTELASCACVEDFVEPECDQYRGMHVRRRPSWGDIQHHVDALASSGIFGEDEILEQFVDLRPRRSQDSLAAEVSHRAQRLIAPLRRSCLSDALLQQIRDDLERVGLVVARMFPTAERLIMKIEIQGHSVCNRWHQDNYVGRAIVSYNGYEGTLHVHNDNVNFWELENCGVNEHIIHDESQVFAVQPGDVLFIKGKHFPHAVNGLVHKAPLKRYHADGSIMHRLTMKVDIGPMGETL